MWIRSQNNSILIDVKKFFINELAENSKIIGYSIDCGSIELARYSTKEKAERVLDLLQVKVATDNSSLSGVLKMPLNDQV